MASNEKITAIVKAALAESVQARNNDKILYLIVLEHLNKGIIDRPISEIYLHLEELGLPCYDTVTRLRRLVQAKNPELRANDKVQDYRSAKEEKCREEFRA